MKAWRGSRGIAMLFNLSAKWGWVVNATSRATLPPGKTRYPLYRRLGGLQCQSGQARYISPPPGFEPQKFQPVASHCTDCAIRLP